MDNNIHPSFPKYSHAFQTKLKTSKDFIDDKPPGDVGFIVG